MTSRTHPSMCECDGDGDVIEYEWMEMSFTRTFGTRCVRLFVYLHHPTHSNRMQTEFRQIRRVDAIEWCFVSTCRSATPKIIPKEAETYNFHLRNTFMQKPKRYSAHCNRRMAMLEHEHCSSKRLIWNFKFMQTFLPFFFVCFDAIWSFVVDLGSRIWTMCER